MFDIGFTELLLVAVVALLVLGPERLPQALRTLGLWLGRMRRSFNSVKDEIEREIGMDEIRRQLHNEAVMDELRRIERSVTTLPGDPASGRTGPAAPGVPGTSAAAEEPTRPSEPESTATRSAAAEAPGDGTRQPREPGRTERHG